MQNIIKINGFLKEEVFQEEGNSAEQLNPYFYGLGVGFLKDSIKLQFCGWRIILNGDGTWNWDATDGG